MEALLALLVALCLLLVVPLGVRLLDLPGGPRPLLWLWAGLLAALGTAPGAGPLATTMCAPLVVLGAWGAAAGVLRGSRALRSHPTRARAARELAALSAAVSLGVVGFALAVDRSGVAPFLGFGPTVWRLTVLHFCVAGFAASLLVGQALLSAPGRAAEAACGLVPLGTALVAAGHFLGDGWELAGAVALATGLLLASAVLLRRVVRWSEPDGQLIGIAAAVTPLTMGLALWWALGEAVDLPHPSLTWTAATHGVGNALGVGVAGVLGWTTLAKEQL